MNQRPHDWDTMREFAHGGGYLALRTMFQIRIRSLVSAIHRKALGVMGQPVLVSIDSNKILETRGDTGFFVGFPLRQAKHDIAFDGTTGNQIFVPSAAMMVIDHACVRSEEH